MKTNLMFHINDLLTDVIKFKQDYPFETQEFGTLTKIEIVLQTYMLEINKSLQEIHATELNSK